MQYSGLFWDFRMKILAKLGYAFRMLSQDGHPG